MPQHRYQPRSSGSPDDETLPLNTQLAILTRQSTLKQSKRNVFSAEVNPEDLIAQGQRLGFSDIQVYDWDTGIGAYSTTIEDRPALKHWLYELLPSGTSRALLVSQEDRLFRDKWETEHNAFIRQVATYGGWVICGQRMYNFRREFDCEQFRMACKYGKQYIEHHIIRRMLPAVQRAAMTGRYTGGPVPWGYVVDYEPHSPTYRRFVRYEPHAALVVDEVFRCFAAMTYPSVFAVARRWEAAQLVFPFFAEGVDERRVRWSDAHCRRDEVRGGYPLHFKTAQRILTEVAYLGWRVRAGEVARDDAERPRICHEPLVAPDLFWWCYDRIVAERPTWAEGAAPPHAIAVSSYRPRHSHASRRASEVLFVASGRVRCAVHQKVVAPVIGKQGHIELHCGRQGHFDFTVCARVAARPVEEALCHDFLDRLDLDERDVAALARVAQERQAHQADGVVDDVQRQLDDQCKRYARTKRLALEAPDLATDVLDEMRAAKRTIGELETRLAEARAQAIPTTQAWQFAERAVAWAERIRATFLEWPRAVQQRVLALALDEAVLGWVDRYSVGVWMRWQGGVESRREIVSTRGRKFGWSDDELAVLRACFGSLTWDALRRMYPARTVSGITLMANRLGLSRPKDGGHIAEPPVVFPEPVIVNAMAAYGFGAGNRVGSGSHDDSGTIGSDGVGVGVGRLSSSTGCVVSSHRFSG